MTGLWWLLLGLLAGWLIELAIDFGWWRKRHVALKAEIDGQRTALDQERERLAGREAQANLREQELAERETVLNGRDADVMAQTRRIDERGEAINRSEQRLESRRAELERHAATLSERERDIAQRQQALRGDEARFTERNDRLVAGEADADKRQSMLASRESALKKWEQRVLAKEKDLNAREREATRLARDAERWRRHYHGMRALIEQRFVDAEGNDDLKVIHGIGKVAERLLHGMGITSFARLAEAPLGELSRLAERGGSELAMADPMSWAEQAQLILDRDYIGFENLKARLRGDVPPAGAPVDEILESAAVPAEPAAQAQAAPVVTGDAGADSVPEAAHPVLATADSETPGRPLDEQASADTPGQPRDAAAPSSIAMDDDPVVHDVAPDASGDEAQAVGDGSSMPVDDHVDLTEAFGDQAIRHDLLEAVGDTEAPAAAEPADAATAAEADPSPPAAQDSTHDAEEAGDGALSEGAPAESSPSSMQRWSDDDSDGIADDASDRVVQAALEAATHEVGGREGGLTGGSHVGRQDIVASRPDESVARAGPGGREAEAERRSERFALAAPTPSRGGGRRRRR